jgi:hypothetical protein
MVMDVLTQDIWLMKVGFIAEGYREDMLLILYNLVPRPCVVLPNTAHRPRSIMDTDKGLFRLTTLKPRDLENIVLEMIA